ncbi:MAG: penicillin-binding protein, partial [Eubacterium sp.]|nr:penicillin-binding protein [Eubacterium sp.]
MNFGKQGVQQERERLDSSAPKVTNRINITILRVIVYLLIAAAVFIICLGIGAYRGIIADAPEITDSNITPLGYASFVYDKDGNQIQKLSSAEGNRVSVSIDEIPENMQHAIVAIEDSRFYEHNGVDPHGMLRAVMVMLSSNFSESEGASTITQQLLKNNVFTNWMNESRMDTIKRKIQEQYLAVQLESSLKAAGENPKEVILENYLNTVNFGNNAYGVQTAAQTYFGKDAKDLTLSECAVLAAIPQNPSQFNPILYPEENASRMKTVLEYMLQQGYITEDEYKEALADNVYDRIQENQQNEVSQESTVYSYFEDELIDQVKQDLMTQKGYSESEANSLIYSGGLHIYSTENPDIQAIMESEFANEENFPADSQVSLDWALTVDKADGTRTNYSLEMMEQYFKQQGLTDFDQYFTSEDEAQSYIDQYKASIIGDGDTIIAERTNFTPEPQACMTVIDQSTGYVVGIVGGRGEKTASLTLNRATDSLRQPGSTFKIPSTYGPLLDQGKITLVTPETDDAAYYSNGQVVNNADNTHHGTMTVRNAILTSNNVIAFKLMEALTPKVSLTYLKKLGFTTLDDDNDDSPGLALGGITNGVSDLELTAAYAAIANGGSYNRPVFYTKVTDHNGNTILENQGFHRQVFKESTAYLLTSAMQSVVQSGTGTAYQLSSGMPVAGKTGTTDSYVDLQFVGYTPYYTAGIWTGYDTNVELSEQDRTYISTLWTNVMNRIHESLPIKEFSVPDSVEQLTVCANTVLLPNSSCPTVTDYF